MEYVQSYLWWNKVGALSSIRMRLSQECKVHCDLCIFHKDSTKKVIACGADC